MTHLRGAYTIHHTLHVQSAMGSGDGRMFDHLGKQPADRGSADPYGRPRGSTCMSGPWRRATIARHITMSA